MSKHCFLKNCLMPLKGISKKRILFEHPVHIYIHIQTVHTYICLDCLDMNIDIYPNICVWIVSFYHIIYNENDALIV